MKNKYFGNSLDYFEKSTTDEKYISGNNLELYKADDPLSARTFNRPLRQLLEDTENSYQIIQNVFKTLYGQTNDETKSDVRIIPDIYEEMDLSGLSVGRFNQDTDSWFLRIPTGAFTAKLPDDLANSYKYTFEESNQYSRDFYIDNDRNATVVFNRPNIELFERQLADHFNINLNDQNNDVRVFMESYTEGEATSTDDIEKAEQLSNRKQKIRYYTEFDNTTYDYKNGITVGTETVRIPQEQNEYCYNMFDITNSVFGYFKSYLTNSDDYYSLEEVIDISSCDSAEYIVYYNPTLETIDGYLYSKTKRFVLIKADDVINTDYSNKIIKLYSVKFSKQIDETNSNRFIISKKDSFLKKIDRTTLSIKNINLTNTINNIVFEEKNNNYNISNAHLPLNNTAYINNINIGTNTLGYPQVSNFDQNPTLFSQAFKTFMGSNNIAIGFESMMNTENSPTNNIAIGYNALKNIGSGSNNIEITTNGKTKINNPDRLINIGYNLDYSIPEKFGSENIVFGRGNLSNAKSIASGNFVAGFNNNIYNLENDNIIISKSTTAGVNARIGNKNVIIGHNLTISGSNKLEGENTIIGNSNTIDIGGCNKNYIFGIGNSLTGSKSISSKLIGDSNILSGVEKGYIVGRDNSVINNTKSITDTYIFGYGNSTNSSNGFILGRNNSVENKEYSYNIGSYLKGGNKSIKIGGYVYDHNEDYVIDSSNTVNIGPLEGIYTDTNTTTTWAIQATNNKYTINYTGSLPVFLPNFVVNAGVIQINNKYLELKHTATFDYGWQEILGGNLISNYFSLKTASLLNTGIFPGTNIYSDGISLSSSNNTKNKNGSIFKQNSDNLTISTHSTNTTFNPIYLEQYRFYATDANTGKSKITLLSNDGSYSQLYNIYPNSTNTYSIGKADALWENIYTRNINLRTEKSFGLDLTSSTTKQYNGVLSLSDVTHLGYNTASTKSNKNLLVDADTLKNWDGSYTLNSQKLSGRDSNLIYCNNGKILGTYGNQVIGQNSGTEVVTTFKPLDVEISNSHDPRQTEIVVTEDGYSMIQTGMLVVESVNDAASARYGDPYRGVGVYSYGDIVTDGGSLEISGDATICEDFTVLGETVLDGEVTIRGDVRANSFEATSARKYKKEIIPTKHSAVDEINKIDIVDFYFKTDENNENPKVGFIADDTDSIFSTPKKDSMDLYNCVGMLLKAVQELSKDNKELKAKVNSIQESK